MRPVPAIRVALSNSAPLRPEADFVLYWMTAFRRIHSNFALDRALEWCRELKKPLVIFEALRCDYPWASDRLHRFLLDGMAENYRDVAHAAALYYPFVEPSPSASKGLLETLASRACVVVTDDFPCFFLPRMVQSAARKLAVRLETIDSNGLLPLRAAPKAFSTAFSFRRFLQIELPRHLREFPASNPLARVSLPRLSCLPAQVLRRWPPAGLRALENPATVAALPIDHHVPIAPVHGGILTARTALRHFLALRLGGYAENRNHPDRNATSGLSPWLHFGHISSHEIFRALAKAEGWSEEKLATRATGSRTGWWSMAESAEAFLDQLVTWREIGFNMCGHCGEYDRYVSLPEWAHRTLEKHAQDKRVQTYSLDQFAAAATHDPLWNAAQRHLSREGRLHNYLRMLWGKKILEWSRTPQEALKIMIDLNNRYALDGRDPNSYSGIFWSLGRYDRPWGPERPVFGTVRYMSSGNTARKLHVEEFVRRYSA